MKKVFSRIEVAIFFIIAFLPLGIPIIVYDYDFVRLESIFGYEYLFYFTIWYIVINFIVDRIGLIRIHKLDSRVLASLDMKIVVLRYILVIISCVILYFIAKSQYGFVVIIGGSIGNGLLPKLYLETVFETNESIISRAKVFEFKYIERFEKTTKSTLRIYSNGKIHILDVANEGMLDRIVERLLSCCAS